MTPEGFPKLFATAFAAQNSVALVAMMALDAQVVSLTGGLAEDAAQAGRIFDQEFAGIFVAARLITGRNRMQALGPGGAVVHQRYVVMGARNESGREVPRFGVVATAVLLATAEGWRAISLTLSALT